MKRSIIRPILAGLIIGAAAFFAPFVLLKLLCLFFIIGAIMRLFRHRSYRRGGAGYYMAYADKIRGMNEAEYGSFKEKMLSRHGNFGCRYNDPQTEPKEENKSI